MSATLYITIHGEKPQKQLILSYVFCSPTTSNFQTIQLYSELGCRLKHFRIKLIIKTEGIINNDEEYEQELMNSWSEAPKVSTVLFDRTALC